MSKKITYRDAGVDVEQGERVVQNLQQIMASTWNWQIVRGYSGFQAIYDAGEDYLVGATDGVGTKLELAFLTKKHDTIGQDLVAMCVNDLVRVGAKPLFFLDYLATGKLEPNTHLEIMQGIGQGCRLAGCALLGGETAEMPGMYAAGKYDLAGFAVGKVKKKEIITGEKIKPGAFLLGIESSGLHSNGYSLARKVIFEELRMKINDQVSSTAIGGLLLEPTIIYVQPVLDLLATFSNEIQGIVHITGGGIPNKLPKCFPSGLGAIIKENWEKPKIYSFLEKTGLIAKEEMQRTFNLGIGLILVVNDQYLLGCIQHQLQHKHHLKSYEIGRVVMKEGIRFV